MDTTLMQLREVLEPDLLLLIKRARALDPGLNATTFDVEGNDEPAF